MRIRYTIAPYLVSVVVALYIAWLAGVQGLRAQDSPASPEVTGSITGTIRSTEGAPLSGVVINLLGQGTYQSTIQTTTTDDAGTYRIDHIFTGLYRLQFIDPAKQYVNEYFDNVFSLDQASDVAVVGNVVSQINAELTAAGGISGTVTMFDGIAPDKATVRVYPAGNTSLTVAELNFDNSAHTQDAFRYTVHGLPTGDYWVEVQGSYHGVSYEEGYDNVEDLYYDGGTPVTVAAGAITPGIDVVLGENPELANLSGVMTLADGSPAPNVLVTALRKGTYDDFDTESTTLTDAAGHYQMRVLPPGLYKVRLGGYDGITDGAYVIEYYENAPTESEATVFSLEAGQTRSDLNGVVARNGEISGTITMYDGMSPTSAEIAVYSAANGFQSLLTTEHVYSSPPNNHLTYVVDGLAPGVYRLKAKATYTGVSYEEFYPGRQLISTAQDIVVEEGAVTPQIDFVLGSPTLYAEVNGQVRSESGEPIGNVKVTVYGEQFDGWQPIRDLSSGPTGLYRVAGLWPGIYRVCFEPPEESHLDECYDNRTWGEATSILLAAGEVRNGIDALLSPEGHIAGTIVTRGVYQLDNGTISVLAPGANGWDFVVSVTPEQEGSNLLSYTTQGLLGGIYRIKLSGYLDDDYFETYYPDTPLVEQAADVTVTLGITTVHIDFTVGDDPFDARIAGLVTAEGGPLEGIRVDAFYRSNPTNDWHLLTFVYTDESGRYQIDGLSAGAYRVRFSDPAGRFATLYYGAATTSEEATTIAMLDGMSIPELHLDMVTHEYSGYTEYRFYLPQIVQ